MDDNISAEVAAIGADTRSGASALLRRAVAVLARVARDRTALNEAAAQLCRAQPSMAGLRTAAAIARTAADPAAALGRFQQQIARAPEAIARHAAALLALRRGTGAIRLVTCSASEAVEATLVEMSRQLDLVACCAEGRPQLEGRNLAARLASRGIAVELYTDAGVGSALPGADALLVGADAVGPASFINKVGTAALCALARRLNVPAYALAGREKTLEPQDFAALSLKSGAAVEVWDQPPAAIVVLNPYFEMVPLGWLDALITDTGVIYEY